MTKSHVIILLQLLFLSGCGIFETRTPEPPQQSRSDFQPPTTAGTVIDNLKNAITDLDVTNYLACLSDTSFGGKVFSFSPSAKAASQYGAIFQAWDKTSEQNYFNYLKSYSVSSSSPVLTLSNETLVPQSSSTYYYSADYTLLWPNKSSTNLQQVQGNLQFYLGIDNNQNWSIYKWVDTGTSDTVKTWSDLKAQFSQ